MNRPPELKKLLIPAILTVFRSKRFTGEKYQKEIRFELTSIQSKKLIHYKEYFGFQESIPLSYFYLLSQGVQTMLMIDKKFPLPIPGMVHLKTKIVHLSEIHLHDPLEIKSYVEIENKSEGSLLPKFKESYYQNGIKVVEIESIYLLKRRSKNKTATKRENSIIENKDPNWLSEPWTIKRKFSTQYAKLSGDYNPIHILSLFAWLSGFKGRIIHGWYNTSRAAAKIERETEMPIKSIEVEFLKPITIPSKATFEFRLSSDRNFQFRIKRDKDKHYGVSGYIS